MHKVSCEDTREESNQDIGYEPDRSLQPRNPPDLLETLSWVSWLLDSENGAPQSGYLQKTEEPFNAV